VVVSLGHGGAPPWCRSLRPKGAVPQLRPPSGRCVNWIIRNLYAVWQDARFSNFQIDQIAFSQSTDGGATWSAPIKVNQTPAVGPILSQQAFTPSVSVESDGTVVINYYDFRNDQAGDDQNELADYWAASCSAACAAAASWGGELGLTSTSFNILDAPLARGYFLGDYEGLAAVGAQSAAAFSIPQGTDPANVVFQKF